MELAERRPRDNAKPPRLPLHVLTQRAVERRVREADEDRVHDGVRYAPERIFAPQDCGRIERLRLRDGGVFQQQFRQHPRAHAAAEALPGGEAVLQQAPGPAPHPLLTCERVQGRREIRRGGHCRRVFQGGDVVHGRHSRGRRGGRPEEAKAASVCRRHRAGDGAMSGEGATGRGVHRHRCRYLHPHPPRPLGRPHAGSHSSKSSSGRSPIVVEVRSTSSSYSTTSSSRRLGIPERRLAARVADRAVAAQPLLEHPQQHRHLAVDVVEDPDLASCRDGGGGGGRCTGPACPSTRPAARGRACRAARRRSPRRCSGRWRARAAPRRRGCAASCAAHLAAFAWRSCRPGARRGAGRTARRRVAKYSRWSLRSVSRIGERPSSRAPDDVVEDQPVPRARPRRARRRAPGCLGSSRAPDARRPVSRTIEPVLERAPRRLRSWRRPRSAPGPSCISSDRMVPVAALRRRRQADDVAGLDLGEDPLERDRRERGGTRRRSPGRSPRRGRPPRPSRTRLWIIATSSRPVGLALACADLADLLRVDAEEHRELREPLVEERLPMDQDERAARRVRRRGRCRPPSCRCRVGRRRRRCRVRAGARAACSWTGVSSPWKRTSSGSPA